MNNSVHYFNKIQQRVENHSFVSLVIETGDGSRTVLHFLFVRGGHGQQQWLPVRQD